MHTLTDSSLVDCFRLLARLVLQTGDGLGCKEIADVFLTAEDVVPDPLFPENEEMMQRTLAYCKVMDAGFRLNREWAEFELLPAIPNPDGTIHGAYGHLIFNRASCGKSQWNKGRPVTPWEWASTKLKADPATRDAVLRFSLPQHQYFGNRDFPSLMHSVFRIRGRHLTMSTVSRCDDLVELIWVLPWLASLQERMLDSLARHYDLECGPFSFFSHSVRLENRDIPAVLELIGEQTNKPA